MAQMEFPEVITWFLMPSSHLPPMHHPAFFSSVQSTSFRTRTTRRPSRRKAKGLHAFLTRIIISCSLYANQQIRIKGLTCSATVRNLLLPIIVVVVVPTSSETE